MGKFVTKSLNWGKIASKDYIDRVILLMKTRTVRGSDYSPAKELSEQKDKLVTAIGDTEKYSKKQANKVWLNSVYWFSRY